MEEHALNPYAPTAAPLDQRLSEASSDTPIWLTILVAVHGGIGVVSVACMFYSIRSILYSGAIFASTGLLTAISAFLRGRVRLGWVGVISILFCAGIFLMIAILELSPQGAQIPVIALSSLFVFASGIYVISTLGMERRAYLRRKSEQIEEASPSAPLPAADGGTDFR
jgi:hypothetical protein